MRLLDLTAVLSLAILSACTGDKGDETQGSADAPDSETDPTTGETTQPTESADTSDTSDTSDTDPAPATCECASGDPCDVPLCEQVRWVDEDNDGELDADQVDAFTASSTCALTALRDGKAGRISWDYYGNGGQYAENGTQALFGDGTVLQTQGGSVDICYYEVDEVLSGPLKPAQFFEDCLADPDIDARIECIRYVGAGMSTACVKGELNCDGV